MTWNFFEDLWLGLVCHLKNWFADPIAHFAGYVDWCVMPKMAEIAEHMGGT